MSSAPAPTVAELPDSFVWVRPDSPGVRGSELTLIIWGPSGIIVASASRGRGKSWMELGCHRALKANQHYREFTTYPTALRYITAWVRKYVGDITAELSNTNLHDRE